MTTPTPSLPAGLLVGWKPEQTPSTSFGFARQHTDTAPPDTATTYTGEGHLMTIAPTGAGKGVGCVIPAIITHQGPVVVMDVKGENYAITHARRAKMGDQVHRIDPFGVTTHMPGTNDGDRSGFNPFDLLPYLSDDEDTACRALADLVISKNHHTHDPFWREAAVGVLAALIQCYRHLPPAQQSISAIARDLAIEIPGAFGIGHIDHQTAVESLLAADPDLAEALDALGCTPTDIWQHYTTTKRGADFRWNPGQDEVRDLLEEGLTQGLLQYPMGVEPEAVAEVVQQVLDDLVESTGHRTRFGARLSQKYPDILHHDTLLGQLWDALDTAKKTTQAHKTPGSYSAQWDPEDGVPDNYPLALHRAALHPSPACRSVAAQPASVDKTWGSILCVLRAYLSEFAGPAIARALGAGKSLDLESLWRGDAQSIYIVFPPTKIRSHANLFRCIVEGILAVLVARTHRTQHRTLLLLDEVAQLGTLPLLITATTLLRGYGVQVWTFWQDIAQLRANYPQDWPTIINNTKVLQIFGHATGALNRELADALDLHPNALTTLAADSLLAWIDTPTPTLLRRPVAHTDTVLRDHCAPGPFSPTATTAGPPPRLRHDSRTKPAQIAVIISPEKIAHLVYSSGQHPTPLSPEAPFALCLLNTPTLDTPIAIPTDPHIVLSADPAVLRTAIGTTPITTFDAEDAARLRTLLQCPTYTLPPIRPLHDQGDITTLDTQAGLSLPHTATAQDALRWLCALVDIGYGMAEEAALSSNPPTPPLFDF